MVYSYLTVAVIQPGIQSAEGAMWSFASLEIIIKPLHQ